MRFENATAAAGPYFQRDHRGRGISVADLDDDGRLDLVISQQNEPAAVLQNVATDGAHWLGVELVGAHGKDAIGALATLDLGGKKLVRQIKGSSSFLSASDRRILFGLGASAAPGTLTVRWPSGATQSWSGLALDRYWRLTEGAAEAQARGER